MRGQCTSDAAHGVGVCLECGGNVDRLCGVDSNQPFCCAQGQACCRGNACTNLLTDRSNCGACGNACSEGDICANGVCIANPCQDFLGGTLCGTGANGEPICGVRRCFGTLNNSTICDCFPYVSTCAGLPGFACGDVATFHPCSRETPFAFCLNTTEGAVICGDDDTVTRQCNSSSDCPSGQFRLLHQLESTQIAGYLRAIPRLSPGPLRAEVASVLANDAQHISILRLAQDANPLPSAFVTSWPTFPGR